MINKIFRIVSAMLGHTHFWQKLNLGISSKLCLHGVAYGLEIIFKHFSDIFGQPVRRGRDTRFPKMFYHTYFGIK